MSNLQEMQRRLEIEVAETSVKSKKQRAMDYKSKLEQLNTSKSRKWYCSHGKADVLDFTDEEVRKLRECFDTLDDDGGGSIGLEELEIPLIGLGLADTREEVEELILSVDDDGNIEFPEFLAIIKSPDTGENDRTALINKFFKDMSQNSLPGGSKDLSFNVTVDNIRRKHMMDAILGHGEEQKLGMKILKNVEVQLNATKIRNKAQELANENTMRSQISSKR